jgi:GNAT superfamily N-acetyltransferase
MSNILQLRIDPLTWKNTSDCHHFFKNELDVKSQYFFMPHPKVWFIAYLIYGAMALRHALGLAEYHLYYEGGQGKAMAFTSLVPGKEANTYSLGLGVSQYHRGKGYGRKLMDDIFAAARQKGAVHLILTHHPDNFIARQLYLDMGFKDDGVIKLRGLFGASRVENQMKCDLEISSSEALFEEI